MAALLSELAKGLPVPLEGYKNQVGGKFLLMKFKDCVCKPLVLRESSFYQGLSKEMRQFTPHYYGVITVCFEKEPSGDIKVFAYPHSSGGVALDTKTLKATTDMSDVILAESNNGAVDVVEGYVSPWCAQCTRISTSKLGALGDQLDTIQQDYIALENLTSRFHCPSILDLKIGCGNHGEYITEAKRLKHERVLQNSTTATLYVRLGGMQKYDASSNQYIFRDKSFGRDLTEEGFKRELKDFLHNGVEFREDLLANIILMLEELLKVVEKQDSYRFFASSLLITYDGAQTRPLQNKHNELSNGACDSHLTSSHDSQVTLSELRKHVDVRMIDFEHGASGSFKGLPIVGCDEDYLRGLKSLLECLKGLTRTQ